MDRLQNVFKNVYTVDLDKPRDKLEQKLEFPELEIRCEIFNFSKLYGF